MSVEVVTLGCRMNLSESEQLHSLLDAEDDLVVINSCAVTAQAVRQTRQAIRRARRARPDARLIVTGCAAETDRHSLGTMIEVDGLVPNERKLDPRAWNARPTSQPLMQRHTRAFVVVQNGCDHACTFCIIPQGRGVARSVPVAQVLRSVRAHLDAGAREVVLTGVDLTSWGHDLGPRERLGGLCDAILRTFPELSRLRLSSVDGIEIDGQLLELLTHEHRVMPHLHLSLQHGDDLVLKRMKRRHQRKDALDLVAGLKARRPEVAIGADLIAGFPSETEQAHRENLTIIADLDVVHGHVFPYSARPGTPAARMPQVETATIKERARQLREAVGQQRARWLQGLIGQPLEVLAERDGTGHAPNFARVALPPQTRPGTVVTLTPTRLIEGLLA